MNDSFIDLVTKQIKKDLRVLDINQEINIQEVFNLVNGYDESFLDILANDENIKSHFFYTKGQYLIFKVEDFKFFLLKNKIDNSYTKYKNKIGLANDKYFLRENNQVVVNFPFKDGILLGGQVKEKNSSKEIIFHQILAKDDIDVLLKPKALCNFKKYSFNQTTTDFQFNYNNSLSLSLSQPPLIQDNLVINGNNLLALHSLLVNFTSQVKLIYIDPPYNTGKDSFGYNDNFNHSTWLLFMKNRLEVAKKLLQEGGSIFIQCDDNEQRYLNVLCDEIFGRHNFLACIIWERKTGPANNSKHFSTTHDYILVYAKNIDNFKLNLLPRTEAMNARYKNPDNDPRGNWIADNFSVVGINANNNYVIINPSGKEYWPPRRTSWRFSKEKFEALKFDNRVWWGKDNNTGPLLKRFLSEVQVGKSVDTIWNWTDVGHNALSKKELNKLVDSDEFATPKPEKLIKRIIEIASNEGDLVLDFFGGSATTGAVALKLKRRFIIIEQMDYIKTVTVERLKKVVNGEQGGISKEVNYLLDQSNNPSTSFVYFELAKFNQTLIDLINNCVKLGELLDIFDKYQAKYFFNYHAKLKQFRHETCLEEAFINMNLMQQKQIFIDLLDINGLYVNYLEAENEKYQLTNHDLLMTEAFYTKN